ncbi:HTH-type transcriptional regulator RpiR [Clostridium puniceum]|uniref:HTH-type transcriptional regulator RpiR n=1 Tax=Clostridium puniceum TaxID=29367 RepID=A0A1S8TYU4_9CLOT|nr:MurR/RpiR family transcriptional regulator [Clostridium puniceum]OOM82585.1 HTH-type transcriptional regulator RpiR [Clostridium puniceum]
MNEYKAMGSVTLRLIDYVNNATKKDINYEIAIIMLKKFNKIKKMNITEISELCYVSPATISRFCRLMGFDNFNEFKKISNVNFSLQNDYSNRLLNSAQKDIKLAFEEYTNSLMKNMSYTLENLEYENLDEVVKQIYSTEKVSFFGTQFLYSVGKHLQSRLMLTDKYIEAYSSYNKQLECARNLDNKSLAIIISIEGSYFFKYMEIVEALKENGVKIVVITQNTNSKLASIADSILVCGNSNSNNEGRDIALYMIELLIFRYSTLYDKN